jgi:hypothetical protein
VANKIETSRVLRAYPEAWLASVLEKVLSSYHDEIELHYVAGQFCAKTFRVTTTHLTCRRSVRRLSCACSLTRT